MTGSGVNLGFNRSITACEPREATDCAPAAQRSGEEGIGRLDGAIK